MGKGITKAVVLGAIALIILYDIIIYAVSGVDATISRVTLKWASDIPIIVLAPGILLGHLFWPQPCPRCREIDSIKPEDLLDA